MRYCVFTIGKEVHAVPVDRVIELCDARGLTEVPRSPTWILGVVHRRGRVVPVVSLTGARASSAGLLVLESAMSPVAVPVDGVLGITEAYSISQDEEGGPWLHLPSLEPAEDARFFDVDGLVSNWAAEVAREFEPTPKADPSREKGSHHE